MIDIDELRLQITYDPDTGACKRKAYRDRYGDLVSCDYEITGTTRADKYGYYRVSIGGKRYLLHKLIYYYSTGRWPDTIEEAILAREEMNKIYQFHENHGKERTY